MVQSLGIYNMNKEAILIVEDDPDDMLFVREAFRMTGYNKPLIEFNTGKLFVDYVKKIGPGNTPSIAIIDNNLPPYTALDILKDIQQIRIMFYFPIIVFTTGLSPRAKEEILKIGACCIVTKPETIEEFKKIISAISLLWYLT